MRTRPGCATAKGPIRRSPRSRTTRSAAAGNLMSGTPTRGSPPPPEVLVLRAQDPPVPNGQLDDELVRRPGRGFTDSENIESGRPRRPNDRKVTALIGEGMRHVTPGAWPFC